MWIIRVNVRIAFDRTCKLLFYAHTSLFGFLTFLDLRFVILMSTLVYAETKLINKKVFDGTMLYSGVTNHTTIQQRNTYWHTRVKYTYYNKTCQTRVITFTVYNFHISGYV